jgi:ribonuclease HI
MYTLSFDGLFRGFEKNSNVKNNAGIMCYGWLISEENQVIAIGRGSYTHRKAASSIGAEYLALIEGLVAIADLGLNHEMVLVMGDAKTVIDQMQGINLVNSPKIKELYRKATNLSQKLPGLQWQWVPRQNNKAADKLTRQALQQISCQKKQSIPWNRATEHFGGFCLISDIMICQKLIGKNKTKIRH